jgi:hypothetical protein
MIGGVKGNQVSDSSAGGDIAGNDIDKSVHIHLNPGPVHSSPLRKKLEQLQADCLHDPNFSKCIKQLNHYLNPVNPADQRDLKTKLTDAGRQDEVYEAEELKESFAKVLVKDNLSEQAQEAYVHILATIKTQYDGKVKPLIKTNSPLHKIESNVLSIVESMYAELAGTALEYDQRQVKGMLYFLTGNCHIDWKY